MLSTQAELTIRDVDDNVLLSGADLVQGGASQNFDEPGNPMVSLELKDPDKFRQITEDISQKPQGENLMEIWMNYEEGEESFAEETQKDKKKIVYSPSVSEPNKSKEVKTSDRS